MREDNIKKGLLVSKNVDSLPPTRIVIESIVPEIDGGKFPVKRVVGSKFETEASVFIDGHIQIAVFLYYRNTKENEWNKVEMEKGYQLDRWTASFTLAELGTYEYYIEAWHDAFLSYQTDLKRKIEGKAFNKVDLDIGLEYIKTAQTELQNSAELEYWLQHIMQAPTLLASLELLDDRHLYRILQFLPFNRSSLTHSPIYHVTVEPLKAQFSTWYELFPRSTSKTPNSHGTFKDTKELLPDIAEMGFDVLYLPPIHPIGKAFRKGRNNSNQAQEGDPGSPWSIGSSEGGHKAIHPQLGTLEDFKHLVETAKKFNIDIALDIAFQCSPDHPYVKEHPEWFIWRPDGTLQYAENPPKKYEDIVPFNFDCENWQALWEELTSVVLYWVEQGVEVFRVDNPHTKPFTFWQWLIKKVREHNPCVIFLSEAFTRASVKHYLAKVGFSQSYTYFTWRTSKQEIVDYMHELIAYPLKEYFRPNFWPQTPDILPEHLRCGGQPAFMIRYALAATLSSNCGIYGPAFELMLSEERPDSEDYLDSEKYELKTWDRNKNKELKQFIGKINQIRKDNAALQETSNITFYPADNESILFYCKADASKQNIVFIALNLDPFTTQSATITIPFLAYHFEKKKPLLIYDLLNDKNFYWYEEGKTISLDPKMPLFIFRIADKGRKEQDFDYFGS